MKRQHMMAQDCFQNGGQHGADAARAALRNSGRPEIWNFTEQPVTRNGLQSLPCRKRANTNRTPDAVDDAGDAVRGSSMADARSRAPHAKFGHNSVRENIAMKKTDRNGQFAIAMTRVISVPLRSAPARRSFR